jgi:Spy/CpxP family protein refolding chaperone
MRKLLIVAGLAVLVMAVGTALMAADTAAPAPPAPKVEKPVGPHPGFANLLGLTQEQKDQIKTILTKARADAKAALDKAREIRKAAFEEIKTKVLTSDQRQKLTDLKERFQTRWQYRGGHRGWRGGRGGPGMETPKAPPATVPKS